MQSGKRCSCQSLGSEVNNILIQTQIPTGKLIQMSVIWRGDLCFSRIITSTWGHFSFNIRLNDQMITSVGIFRFTFYFQFFEIQINTFPECLQSTFSQPNHHSLLTLVPQSHPTFVWSLQMNSLHSVEVKGQASSLTFTPAYLLVSDDVIVGTSCICLCVKKRLYTLLVSQLAFFFFFP